VQARRPFIEADRFMKTRTTITIARQMGSGGAYVGQLIARRFNLRYIDREVLHLAAQSLGVADEAVEAGSERLTSFWEKLFGPLTMLPPDSPYTPPPPRSFSDDELFRRQCDALKLIAAEEDCLIVGYGGAFVLPRHAHMLNLYFHAPLRFRVNRVIEIYDVTDAATAERMIAESDEMRGKYFKQMTGRDWACANNYHLCLDTSLYSPDELAERLVKFIESRIGIKASDEST
jgi:CMP/dCMP kinase